MHPPAIRSATPDDRDAVIGLWHGCGLTRPWNDPQADFARALAGPASTVLVAQGEGAPGGTVMVGYDGHRGWLYYLAVAPERRREGLGRALVAAAEAWLHAQGAPKIQLMVREDNAAALGFYAALGFEPQKVVTLGRFFAKEGA